jgi:uncharacterized RDD family membrane protein YckC
MTFYKYAGFWRRLIAFTIDCTIISSIFTFLFTIMSMAYFFGAIAANSEKFIADLTDPARFSLTVFLLLLFLIFINTVYFTYFHGATGKTPGKMILGVEVVSDEGSPISFGDAFLRSVGYLVSSLVFTIPIGFIWIAFDKRKQGWHDKIAGTVVIIREAQDETAGISISDSASSG